MEGVMVSAFSGAMNSLLTKLATLLEDYKLLKDVKKDITSLRGELSSMNALLVKLSDMEELDVQHKEWRDKVRELAYDMEDCVDIFMNDLDHGDAKAGLMHGLKTLKARYKIANLMKDLKARAVEVSNCRDRYKLDEHIVRPRAVAIDPRLLALHAEAASLVGVDGPKEELIKLLTNEEGIQRLQVISIVGFGGIGKTTLANQVYTTIKGQYDCSALVSVSRNPDMVKILSGILSGVGCREYSSQDDVDQLIDRLKEHLKDKRYLIVIDDIWTAEAWKIIECCFVENNRGGRVITTTRYENVAKACCSCFHGHGHVYQIKPLSDHDSRRLFHRRVFDSEDACPEQLNKVSNEIVQKCGGVPLAILCVASILSSREEVRSKESWETIQNYLGSQLERNHTLESEWMRHVLNLGYNDLLLDLKMCMLYLGIFPEDYEIMKDDLMRRWIAEGFVSEKYRYGVEEVAESYFNELINRNMIQIARLDDCGEVMSCRVHDLMLDFIISKSTEENFMSVINDQYSSKGSLEVRRLSLQVRNSERNQMLANMALTQARSFNFWCSAQGMPSLTKFRLLRVLHLDVNSSIYREYDLSSICNLFRLRYLRTRGVAYCEQTLKQLRKLQHLKTLHIICPSGFFSQLDVGELPSTLCHLIVPATVELFGEIGRMRVLRTLETDLCDVETFKELGELSNLRELKLVRCSQESYGFLLSSLCKLGISNLRSLSICGEFRDNDILSSWSPPPCHLRRLHVLGCPFSMVPDWIEQIDKLSSLEVQVLSLSRNGTEALARLPCLVHLRLHVENVREEGVVIRGTAFPNLKEFWFRCTVLCLTFEAGAMPRIQSLEIECSADGARQDDGVLTGIKHLGSLKVFKVGIHKPPIAQESGYGLQSGYVIQSGYELQSGYVLQSGYELPRWDERSLEAALRKAINKHPGSPDVSIRTIYGYC